MNFPQGFIDSISDCAGFSRADFIAAHEQQSVNSIRFNPLKTTKGNHHFSEEMLQQVPWCKNGVYLKERPKYTLDPLLHAGAYYVQEASSMFIHHVVEQLLPNQTELKVLDLCAAPGGKSSLLASMDQFDFVLSNEIIGSRVPVLYENTVKWGSAKMYISNNDPADFLGVGELFDVVMVDAPCSGSGLFRKDEGAMKEWNIDMVNFCSLRQQRILQAATQALKPGGYLIYSTCSYSTSENEGNLDFLMDAGIFSSLSIETPVEWKVVESHSSKHAAYGYRFYPDKIMGEGFFCGVLQKNDSSNVSYMSEHSSNVKTLNTRTELASWIKPEGALIFEEDEVIYAVRENHLSLRGLLKSHLRLRKSGVKVGAVMKKGLVPDHELALSELLSSEVKRLVLNKIDAISYLRKEDIAVQDCHEGLHLVSYLGCGIGWAKVVSGRIKNNYPMSWRIMMRNDHK